MAPLPSNLRRELERAIIRARELAEQGSREAIEALTVHEGKRGAHVTSEADVALRNHLRAHARQIGDRRNSQSGAQAIDRLVQECAYEHWHRMIFARFLAENSLLVEPESQVAVSLEDVEELARDEGIDRWELAGQYAQQSLPAIFRPDDPLLQLRLPREIRLQLDGLLDELPRETFLADDSLGWVYQFWQSAEKERVNNLGDKITGETLSAVTQLFTEHYMVLFLLHNTLGAWYAGKILAQRPELAESAKTEQQLRDTLRLSQAGGYDFEYLRFVRSNVPSPTDGNGASDDDGDSEPTGPWRPMGGTFDGWPKLTAELKVLDPCCGSGHFLVATFELLVRLRMLEESLSVEAAVDAVIQDNLFGLELDPRCTQIAAFNVAVAAWKLAGPRPLPAMKNIACTGLSVGVPRDQWMKALESDGTSNLRFYFGQLYDMFSHASTLGSLINPNRFLGSHMLKKEEVQRLFAALETVIASDPATAPEQHELGVAAQGLTRAAELLAKQYTLVLTNVPYLGRSKQDEVMITHIDQYYSLGKADLSTAFVLRCLEFCDQAGTTGLVTPQNWFTLKTYRKMRESLLAHRELNVVALLGSNAFQDMNWWAANTALTAWTLRSPSARHCNAGIDVSDDKQREAKSEMLRGKIERTISIIPQSMQLDSPDSVIDLSPIGDSELIRDYFIAVHGLTSGDNPRLVRDFWEFSGRPPRWSPFQVSSKDHDPYAGRQSLLDWSSSEENLVSEIPGFRPDGIAAWGKLGVAVARVGTLNTMLYTGDYFSHVLPVLIPKEPRYLLALWCFCESGNFEKTVRSKNPSLSVDGGYFETVPFDYRYWEKVAQRKYPQGLPEPESDDPSQWLFHGRPDAAKSPTQVAIARLLSYRWPAELDSEMRLSDRARQLVQSCDELLPFADEDGIVCIPSVRGEDTAAARLTRMLEACNLKPPHKLDDWLRSDFFQEHCDLFQQRPFIWHIWDGRKADGFHALVNYHKLAGPNGYKLLENLTYSYLGDWINRQESDVKRGESGADGRLAAAKTLQQQLVAILQGEPPYDIFVRWKPLHEQPIGWNPDINDGVRINIRPFLAVDIPGGRKGAGILRWGPKIKWTKDRGKEPKRPRDEYPWFWGWDEQTPDFPGTDTFTGDRWNDCHYTNAFKQQARERHQERQ